MFTKKNTKDTTGKFGTIMKVVSLALTVKATVWDKMTPEQKARLIESARGAALRTKDQGFSIIAKVKSKADSILKTKNSSE